MINQGNLFAKNSIFAYRAIHVILNLGFKRIKIFFYFILGLFSLSTAVYAQDGHYHGGNQEFIENKNQWGKNILYKSDISGGAVYLEKNGFTFVFKDVAAIQNLLKFKNNLTGKIDKIPSADFRIKCHAYKINFLNARLDALVSADEPKDGYYNYYLGKDKTKWASKVKSYGMVLYKSLYEKTDLKVYESDSHMKYDFILHPGAAVDEIKLQYEGLDNILLREGNLYIKTSVNEVTELSPDAYQMNGNNTTKIECKYKLSGNVLTFIFPKGYDKSKDLIIDPTLIFSTYSGSTIDNWGFTATFDSYGNAYSGGIAFGTGYPVSVGAFQEIFGGGEYNPNMSNNYCLLGCDAAIIKYDSSGTHRLWATYLGGSRNDMPHSMIVNTNDELVLYGTTGSSDFPVTNNAYDKTFMGGDSIMYDRVIKFSKGIDIFVSKIKADGTALLASTYIGGTKNDGLNDPSILSYNYADGARGEVMTDENNNVYVVSTTNSIDFPVTANAFQNNPGGGGQDACMFKMNSSLSNLLWSSYLGGSGNDAAYGIALDNDQNAYIAGGTSSPNFPVTAGALHTSYLGGISDGFITKINNDASSILKSTYYGSMNYDQAYLIQRDKEGYIYVYGQTADSLNTLIYNANWATDSGGQFISKINFNLDTLIWSTNFGKGDYKPDISPTAFLVDLCNKIYISGWGSTLGLPITSDAYQDSTNGSDYYLLVMSDDASALIYATYFGSPNAVDHVDGGTSRFDRRGRIYQSVCAGCNGSWDDFPTTPGAWSNTDNSPNCNNALFKFDFNMPLVIADFIKPEDCGPLNINFQNTSHTSGAPGVNYLWTFGDGSNSTQINPTHLYSIPGTYNVTLIVSDTGSCNASDTITKHIVITDLIINAEPDTAICKGNVMLSANATATGGVNIYVWSTTNNFSDTLNNPLTNNSVIVSPLVSTTYYVQAFDQYNCSRIDSVRVNIVEMDAIISFVSMPSCKDSCNGHATVIPSGGISPYTYLWSNSETSQTVNDLCAGSYSVTVYDAYHCPAIGTVLFTEPSKLEANLSALTSVCSDSCNAVALAAATGGTPQYTYHWDNGKDDDFIMYLCSGTYYITVTDVHDCRAIDSVSIPDSIIHPPDIYTYADHSVIYYTQSTGIHTTVIPNATYSWSPAGSVANPSSPNTIATPPSTTMYIVTIIDQFGCEYKDTIIIYVNEVLCDDSQIFVPNAFTPNDDNNNDVVYVRSNVLKSIYFAIYDHWGERVFETSDMNTGWDGTFRGRKCDPEVFDYYLKATCINDMEFVKKGNITLIK